MFSINDFVKIANLVKKPKKEKSTDKAILFSGYKNDVKYNFWIPKSLIAKKDKDLYVLKTFEIQFLEPEFEEINFQHQELPPFFPIYKEAKRAKVEINNIGSHLILRVDKKSTSLKDKFVKSGGDRNWNIFAQGDGDYYIFYGQYSPWFEEKKKIYENSFQNNKDN